MPRPEDLDFLTKLDADPDVMRYIHEGALSRRDAREFAEIAIEMAPRRAHLHKWLMETASEGLRIGWTELTKYRQESKRDDSDDEQLSYELSPECWAMRRKQAARFWNMRSAG